MVKEVKRGKSEETSIWHPGSVSCGSSIPMLSYWHLAFVASELIFHLPFKYKDHGLRESKGDQRKEIREDV